MKNKELFEILELLQSLAKHTDKDNAHINHPRFLYALVKNYNICRSECREIEAKIKPSPAFIKCIAEEQKILEKFVEIQQKEGRNEVLTDKDGNVVFKEGGEDAYLMQLEKFRLANKETYETRLTQIEEYKKFLEQENSELDKRFHKMHLEWFSDDALQFVKTDPKAQQLLKYLVIDNVTEFFK